MVSCTWRSSSPSSAGAWSAARLSWSSTAVSDWPTSSCSSRAMRRRSASCADRARALLVARSSSSRSSMVLYVVISSAISPRPPTAVRCPGRSRSVVFMARVRRWSGASPTRSSRALATSMAASPTVSTAASVSSTGVDTVTGPRSRAVATIRTTAFSRKMRQNRGTRFRLLAVGCARPRRPAAGGAARAVTVQPPPRTGGGAIGDSPHFPGAVGPGPATVCVPVPLEVGGRDGWLRPCASGDPGGTVPGG